MVVELGAQRGDLLADLMVVHMDSETVAPWDLLVAENSAGHLDV